MRHTATAVIIVAMYSAPALGQTGMTKPPVPQHQIVSTNPFGLLFNWFNAEYERKIGPATTLAVSGSHFADLDLTNAALVLRWYPQRAALDGFFLGARAVALGVATYDYEYPTSPAKANPSDPSRRPYPISHRRTRFHPGAGLEVGYNWLLGPRQNVSIGLGFGLTRILPGDHGDDYPPVVPSPRLINIGIAF